MKVLLMEVSSGGGPLMEVLLVEVSSGGGPPDGGPPEGGQSGGVPPVGGIIWWRYRLEEVLLLEVPLIEV